jgi:hypothetical protein
LLQSVVAVAFDSHQFEQQENQHEIISEHAHDQAEAELLTETDENSSLYCLHCCHCHSTNNLVLADSSYIIVKFNNQFLDSTPRVQYLSQFRKSLYRPPIA